MSPFQASLLREEREPVNAINHPASDLDGTVTYIGPTAIDLSQVAEHEHRLRMAHEARRLEFESRRREKIALGQLRSRSQSHLAQQFY